MEADRLPRRDVSEQTYRRRIASLLDNFWDGRARQRRRRRSTRSSGSSSGSTPATGAPSCAIGGSIDRIDRLPSGGIEVLDYKTGSPGSQKSVDESLQLSIYALACREVLGLGTPERVTLYFTEAAIRMSTARTDDQLDAARDELLARAAVIRSGDFRATPSRGRLRPLRLPRDLPEPGGVARGAASRMIRGGPAGASFISRASRDARRRARTGRRPWPLRRSGHSATGSARR